MYARWASAQARRCRLRLVAALPRHGTNRVRFGPDRELQAHRIDATDNVSQAATRVVAANDSLPREHQLRTQFRLWTLCLACSRARFRATRSFKLARSRLWRRTDSSCNSGKFQQKVRVGWIQTECFCTCLRVG